MFADFFFFGWLALKAEC